MMVGPVALDELEHALRRRALGENTPGRAHAEGEQRRGVARVAEEELRDWQHDVVRAGSRARRARSSRSEMSGSCAQCTAAFGAPVLPVVNFQMATSSRLVGVGIELVRRLAVSVSKLTSPARARRAPPDDEQAAGSRARRRLARTRRASSPSTTATSAREYWR